MAIAASVPRYGALLSPETDMPDWYAMFLDDTNAPLPHPSDADYDEDEPETDEDDFEVPL